MTAPAALAFRALDVGGAREWLFGRPRDGTRPLLILQPLFAEMNRCRALVADLMLALSARGFAPWTLDLPGMGESERALATVGWADWDAAVTAAAVAIAPAATIALRGGGLLEPAVERRWRFAPVDGDPVLRDLVRARLAGEVEPRTDVAALHRAMADGPVDLAGYRLAPVLSQALRGRLPDDRPSARTVSPGDIVRDRAVEGAMPWRRAEPGRAPDLARALADDIAAWLA